jgi:hypothetical protein
MACWRGVEEHVFLKVSKSRVAGIVTAAHLEEELDRSKWRTTAVVTYHAYAVREDRTTKAIVFGHRKSLFQFL